VPVPQRHPGTRRPACSVPVRKLGVAAKQGKTVADTRTQRHALS